MNPEKTKFTLEYIERLARKTYEQELAEAGRMLDERRGKETPLGDVTRISGGTALARSKKSWPMLRERLRDWLPPMMNAAGIDENRLPEMLEFISERMPISEEDHLSVLLPKWLREATGQPANLTIDSGLLDLCSVRLTLTTAGAGKESKQAYDARRALLQAATVVKPVDFLRLPDHYGLPDGYWTGMYTESTMLRAEGAELWLEQGAT